MENYNFCYNYGFLADWLRANPKIKRYDVLHEMGMSDYRTLQNWMEGKTMMPLTQMMKFCNLCSVPITAFFFDENAQSDSFVNPIPTGAMIEPVDGWKASDRRTGIKQGDPRTNIHYISNLPAYCENQNVKREHTIKQDTQSKDNDIPHSERMRYLDIIEQQNKYIMKLTSENTRLNTYNTYQYNGMVAEDDPTQKP